jgi:hypothetical protein
MTKAYEHPLSVEVCEGEVVLRSDEGPFAVALTADAAAQTAEQLAKAARAARGGQASQTVVARD